LGGCSEAETSTYSVAPASQVRPPDGSAVPVTRRCAMASADRGRLK